MSFFAPLKAIYGAYQANQAGKALRNLASQPEPTFRDPNSILQEATSKTPTGYSAAERAAFMQNLQRLNTLKYRNATQSNPNLAANVGAGIDYGRVGAINEFAANDANLRRERINRLAGDIAQTDIRNTTNAINNRRAMEQAYGQAYQAGVGNVMNLFDQIDRDAASLTSIVTGMPAGGGGSTQKGMTTTTAPMLPAKSGAAIPNTIYDNSSVQPFNTTMGRASAAPMVTEPTLPAYNQQDWIMNPNRYNPYKY